MRSLLLFGSFAAVAWAQAPAITQGPFVANISRSAATITWTTDIPATTKIKSDLGDNVMADSNGDGQAYYVHTGFIGGKTGSTLTHYQVCSTANATETCSSIATFTTAAGTTVSDPIPPAPVDTPSTPAGTVRVVGATSGDCNDPSDGLVARWTASARGDIVEIPAGMVCAGTYTFPAKSAGPPYILTRVASVSTTFPSQRRTAPADKPQMARFIQNAPDIILGSAADPTADNCFHRNYLFRDGQGTAFSIYRCQNVQPHAITAITSTGNLRVTVPSHSYPNGYMTHIEGATGTGAGSVNGDFLVYVIDADTLELHPYIDSGAVQATGAASGGTIWRNTWVLEPFTNFTGNPPSSCTWGQWFQKTDGSLLNYQRTYYCNNNNELVLYRNDYTPGSQWYTLPVIDLVTNAPNYLMFQGLSFEPLNMKGDGTLPQYTYYGANLRTGLNFSNFVIQGSATNHIYWDNILGSCPDPTPSGFMGKCLFFSMAMNGSNWHVGNSYFSGFQEYSSLNGIYDGMSGVFVMYNTGPHEFINNYIACSGICVYYPDDVATLNGVTDLTFMRNTVETPDKYWGPTTGTYPSRGSPDWLGNGMYWTQRHRMEFKHGQRARIEGNTYKGGWIWNNNASALCLCTRGGAHGPSVIALNGTVIDIYPESAVNGSGMVTNLHAGDKLVFLGGIYLQPSACPALDKRMWTVASSTRTQVTLAEDTGCTGSGIGYTQIARAMSDSNYIGDVLVKNNTFLNNPADVYSLGHDSYSSPNSGYGVPSTVQQRIKFENNLSIGVDGTRQGPGNAFTGSGWHFSGYLGAEDFQFLHETSVGRVGSSAFFGFTSNAGQGSGLRLMDNVFENSTAPTGALWNDGAYFGDDALVNGFVGMSPAYTASNNVVLRTGGSSGIGYPYPTGTSYFDTAGGASPFFSAAQSNYRVKLSSSFISGGANRASDGLDMGADIDALESAQGKVTNARVHSVAATSAVVGFLAPDSLGCSVDWSTDYLATFTRVPNPGGSRTQNVSLNALPRHTAIAYRINCVAEQPVGPFVTQ